MKYKYAEAEGWYYQIDDEWNKSQSWNAKNRPVMYQEMQDWVSKGNEIEPQFTAEELAEKEVKEKEQALESQNQTLISLLNISEIHVSNDPPYPEDIDAWKNARKEWRKILKSGTLQEIYPKPF